MRAEKAQIFALVAMASHRFGKQSCTWPVRECRATELRNDYETGFSFCLVKVRCLAKKRRKTIALLPRIH